MWKEKKKKSLSYQLWHKKVIFNSLVEGVCAGSASPMVVYDFSNRLFKQWQAMRIYLEVGSYSEEVFYICRAWVVICLDRG